VKRISSGFTVVTKKLFPVFWFGFLGLFVAVAIAGAVWTKRSQDGMVALERFFHHIRWFSEYKPDTASGAG